MNIVYTPIACVLFALLALTFLINSGYLFFLYNRFAFREEEEPEDASGKQPVSVIICARNEADNLQQYLPAILEQDYPEYEVIVVNDCSFDHSKDVLDELSAKYAKLRVVQLEENSKYKHGKKFALTLGIKTARYDQLLLTDADCIPTGNQWIAKMMEAYADDTEIVLGYSPYMKEPGFLNKFIRFETFMTALNYLSFAVVGKPYMGVGRNLSYKKDLFFRNKGFAKHIHLPSGDDDLFVNANATAHNTRIAVLEESMMYSEPKRSFSDYRKQKGRHMSVGKYYKSYHKIMLSIRPICSLLFYAALIISLIFMINWEVAAGFFAVYLLFQTITYRKAMIKLEVRDLWPLSFFYDLIYNLYLALFTVLRTPARKVKWK